MMMIKQKGIGWMDTIWFGKRLIVSWLLISVL
jgi:hypothetical protein